MGETISISSQLPTQVCGCKECVWYGEWESVSLCYRQRLPVLLLFFTNKQENGPWYFLWKHFQS